MSGQHDKHMHQIAVKFHHKTWRQIEKEAEGHRMTPGQYIRFIVSEEVAATPLTAEDAQIIADRIKEAEQKGKMV